MKRKFLGIVGIISFLILLPTLCWGNDQKQTEEKTYAMFVEGEPDAASEKVWQGVTAAAEKAEMKVKIYVQNGDVKEQLTRMREEDEIGGIICFREREKSDQNADQIRNLCERMELPIVIIGEEERQICKDDRGAGIQMAQEALKRGAKSIVFLLKEQDREALRQLEGAYSVLTDEIQCTEIRYLQDVTVEKELQQICRSDTFFLAMGWEATCLAVQLKENGQISEDNPVFGIGSPMETEALENGTADVLFYPSYFTLGYGAFQQLSGTAGKKEEIWQAPYRMITMENMYDSENVSYVFPLLN